MKKYNYIYIITNIVNGKIYIGKHSTNNLDDGYMGSGKKLRLAKNKYGIENFTKEYLAFCDTEEKLNYLEKFYIKKYNTQNPEIGYNLTDGGDGITGLFGIKNPMYGVHRYGKDAPMYGKHHSEWTKQKQSKSHKGKETWMKGKHHTEEAKEKLKKPKPKFKWLTPAGEIKIMDMANAYKHHPDWIKIK